MQDDCLMLELPAFWTTLFGDRFDWLCLHAISFEELHTNQIEELGHWYPSSSTGLPLLPISSQVNR